MSMHVRILMTLKSILINMSAGTGEGLLIVACDYS